MPANTKPLLLDQLRHSGLLEPAQLEELAALPEAQDPDPHALGKQVFRRGWLTRFQLSRIAQGRASDLLVGPYVLLDRLGEGGMGEVFKARHRHMGRVVALKVIRQDRLRSAEAVQRFYQEVKAAAHLQHHNIVLAFDAGEAGGTHYLSMELVEGQDLARTVKEGGPLPVWQACEYVRQAAQGLQHAFEKGMVHRDIKPHNLLVGTAPDGSAVVKILDMGLARLSQGLSERQRQLTQTGTVMGTPDYLAPEQALDARSADVRADLYSLGCTLYFLLTGRAPFHAESLTQLLLMHQMEEPTPLRSLRPDVPPGVEEIVRRLLAKRPEDRPQTPAELIRLLQPYCSPNGTGPAPAIVVPRPAAPANDNPWATLATDPDRIPPPRARSLTADATHSGGPADSHDGTENWGRGKPDADAPANRKALLVALVGAAILVPVLALLALGVTYLAWRSGHRPHHAAPRNPAPVAEAHPDGGAPAEPPAAPRNPAPPPAQNPAPPQPPPDNPALAEVRPAPAAPAVPTSRELRRFAQTQVIFTAGLDFSPDSRRVLDASGQRPSVFDVDTGQLVRRPEAFHPATFQVGRFAPDGEHAYLAAADHKVYSWDLDTNLLTPLFPMDGFIHALALSADGRRLLVGAGNPGRPGRAAAAGCEVRVWDVPGQREVCRFEGHEDPVSSVTLSADGRRALSLSDTSLRLWDPETGKEIRRLMPGMRRREMGAAFLFPDGRQALLLNRSTGQAIVWDVEADRVVRVFGGNDVGMLQTGALAPDGRHAVTATQRLETLNGKASMVDCLLHLWDVTTGQELRRFEGHAHTIGRVAISPNSRYAVSLGFDQTMRLWDLFPDAPAPARPPLPAPPAEKEPGPDGDNRLLGHAGSVTALATARDAHRLLSGDSTGQVYLWDTDTRKQLRALPGAQGEVRTVALSPDGRFAAAGGPEGRWVWDTATGEHLPRCEHRTQTTGLVFTGDSTKLVACGARGTLDLLNMERKGYEWGRSAPMYGVIRSVSRLPGDALFLFVPDDGTIHVFDFVNHKEPGKPLRGAAPVTRVLFPSNGSDFAALSDRSVQLWNIQTGVPGRTFRQGERINDLAYTPDGRHLLTAGEDKEVRLWDTRLGLSAKVFVGHTAPVLSVAVSGDGRLAFSGGEDRTIRVWELPR